MKMRFTPKVKREEGQGNFFKLKNGGSEKVVLRGEIHEFKAHWDQSKKTYVIEANQDPELNNRFRVNVVIYDGGEFKALIWEFGLTVYSQLEILSQDYDLTHTKIRVTRQGEGTDTVYQVTPLPEGLGPQTVSQIEAVKLNILEHRAKPEAHLAPSHEEGEDDLPF